MLILISSINKSYQLQDEVPDEDPRYWIQLQDGHVYQPVIIWCRDGGYILIERAIDKNDTSKVKNYVIKVYTHYPGDTIESITSVSLSKDNVSLPPDPQIRDFEEYYKRNNFSIWMLNRCDIPVPK
ncbi:Hypothetical protein HVR_LOCUS493 [uncultured virus]|nr:Hypothetical protein HVR_LOCUS493 [uncultured virus]